MAASAAVPVAVPKSRQIDFTSTVTNRPYRLMIALPEGPPPPRGYPVVYVIDGNLYFMTVVDAMRLQGRHFIKPTVVVGIGYQTDDTGVALTVRSKDLTPPVTPAQLDAPMFKMLSGGTTADQFGDLDRYLEMIEREVKPAVSALAPVDPSTQVLFGHSLGGLAVPHQLFRRPGAYTGYIASSPSIWFNDRAVLQEEAGLAEKLAALNAPRTLLLDTGSTEDSAPKLPAGYPVSQAAADAMARQMGMVANVIALGARLKKMPGLRATTVVFAHEDHTSVVPAAISRGLRTTLAP
jgi:predicted alpha/beta superfamily hydrolase